MAGLLIMMIRGENYSQLSIDLDIKLQIIVAPYEFATSSKFRRIALKDPIYYMPLGWIMSGIIWRQQGRTQWQRKDSEKYKVLGRPNVCYIFEKQEGFICPTNIAFIWITFLNQYVANFQKHHPYCLGKISLKYHKINVGAPQSSKQNILFARPWQRQMMWTWLGQWVASSKTNNQPFPIWKLKAI